MSRLELWQEEIMAEECWDGAGDFKACVHSWAEKIGVRPARVQIQRMTRKWASCSPRGVLSFSRDLLEQPREVGEAVIVHELVHLKVRNHGPVFKSLMRAYLPDCSVDLAHACNGRTET